MTIYNVFNFDEFVGTFWIAAFTSNDKAETFILQQAEQGYDIANWYVSAYTLDSE